VHAPVKTLTGKEVFSRKRFPIYNFLIVLINNYVQAEVIKLVFNVSMSKLTHILAVTCGNSCEGMETCGNLGKQM
jgi:hypothetical protein